MAKYTFSTFLVKNFWYIIFVLVAATFVISYWGLAKPKLDVLKAESPLDPTPYLSIIERQKTYLANLQRLIAGYDNLNLIRLEKLDQLIGTKADMPNTLVMMVRLAEHYGIEIKDINFEQGDEEMKIRMGIAGKDYNGFKEYLKELESNVRLIDLHSLSFSVKNNSYGLQLVVYHLK